MKEFLFENRERLFAALAMACCRHLDRALEQQGSATLMVSGGNTPAPLYRALAAANLNWRRIHVALVDERWVEKEHEASNEALIERTLLIDKAADAAFTGMKTPNDTAAAGYDITENLYQLIPQPYTVTLLGMGNDGHTASLFPYAQGLEEALDEDNDSLTAPIVAQQSPVTGPYTERLSLTVNGLLKSERLILLLTGEEKMDVIRQAQQQGPVEAMPVRAILKQSRVPVELYWAP